MAKAISELATTLPLFGWFRYRSADRLMPELSGFSAVSDGQFKVAGELSIANFAFVALWEKSSDEDWRRRSCRTIILNTKPILMVVAIMHCGKAVVESRQTPFGTHTI